MSDDDAFRVLPGDLAVGLLAALVLLAWMFRDVLVVI